MSPSYVLTLLAIVGLGATLVGVVRRRLYRACFSFPAYAATVLVTELMILLWPDRYHVWGFWMGKEALLALLKVTVALEIASLSFAAFPGARATSRWLTASILTATVVAAAVAVYSAAASLDSIAQALHSWLANGTACLFVGVWAVVLYYRLPLHPFHRALLRGFVPYMAVFTLALGLVRDLGDGAQSWIALADGTAYVLLVVCWAVYVWTYRAQALTPLDLQLQPWRARL
ncbi:MAG TPA: hypothetical protein VF310_11685 [Vicinamibacteria bacterium]